MQTIDSTARIGRHMHAEPGSTLYMADMAALLADVDDLTREERLELLWRERVSALR